MTRKPAEKKGFLTRLLHNQAGNTLAITAAATIPLVGMIGGGVDISRLYLVKTRLQQACDAGALAGRKAQAGGIWTTAHQNTANQIFATNFESGSYGTAGLNRTFTESQGTVTGTASVAVPMMIMNMFGFDQKTITVTCDAEMRLPNSDIMFVLDVTGSMGDPPTSGGTASKLSGLKTAVQCFYEILMKTDTPASCGSTPSGGISNDIQVRFGFVPYNVNVNVGKLLPNSFLADNWSYQTRVPNTTPLWTWTAGTESSISWGSWSSPPSNINTASGYSSWSTIPGSPGYVNIGGTSWPRYRSASNSSDCTSVNTNGGAVGYIDTGNMQPESSTSGAPVYPASVQTINYSQSDVHSNPKAYKYTWFTSGSASQRCRLQEGSRSSYTLTRTGTSTKPVTWTQYQRIDNWTYKLNDTANGATPFNVSGLKAGGSSWNSSVALPIGSTSVTVKLSGSNSNSNLTIPADTTVNWDGCIEERQTVRTTNFNPIPSGAKDLNIDLSPTSDTTTQWGPLLPAAVWGREDRTTNWWGGYSYSKTTNNITPDINDDWQNSRRNWSYFCPTVARKLARYTTATQTSDFVSYVNSLTANGNTYHDIGLLWGARLMSPTGIFSSENAFTPQGGEIERHLIFMTDGQACTGTTNYTAYGVPWWDRRQTDISSAPTDGCSSTTSDYSSATLTYQVELRTEALCAAIKNKNITLWVVNYGGSIDDESPTAKRLKACASPGRYYEATSTTDLLTTFQAIAAQISQLRLTN